MSTTPILKEAVRLLHMLESAGTRRPDVAAFLDRYEAWMAAPDDTEAWERMLGEMRERSADSDQLARIEGDAIVIRVPLHALVSAMEWHPLRGDPAQPPKCRIVDLPAFAREVVDRLNDFGEGNDCPVTEILDDAMHDVIDAGSESIWIAGDPQ